MDHKELARKIREAIFDRAEQAGRVMHGDAIDSVIEGVLKAELHHGGGNQALGDDVQWGNRTTVWPIDIDYKPVIQGGITKRIWAQTSTTGTGQPSLKRN